MPLAVDVNSLTKSASAYQSISGDLKEWVIIALLAQIAGAPYSTMTADQLTILASPYQAIAGVELAKQVQVALLATIAVEV